MCVKKRDIAWRENGRKDAMIEVSQKFSHFLLKRFNDLFMDSIMMLAKFLQEARHLMKEEDQDHARSVLVLRIDVEKIDHAKRNTTVMKDVKEEKNLAKESVAVKEDQNPEKSKLIDDIPRKTGFK